MNNNINKSLCKNTSVFLFIPVCSYAGIFTTDTGTTT